MTAPGVHISFFDAGEDVARELPAIGPLNGVLLRGDRLVIEHADVAVPDEPGIAVSRWLEGVVELQRATGETPGGRRRASMRVSAPDGLYLRFGTVGEPAGALREFGPFARVFVGARTIEANGDVLASRPSREGGTWTLTAHADPHAVGAQRPDVGFRSAGTPHHSWLAGPERRPPQGAAAPNAPAASSAPESPSAPAAPRTPIAARPIETPPTPPPPPATPAASQRVLKDSDLDLLQRRARRQKEDEARESANAREVAAAREAAIARELALRQATAREDAARDLPRGKAKKDDTFKTRSPAGKRQAAGARKSAARAESATSRHVARALSTAGTPVEEADEDSGWLGVAWRLRFVLLGVLVVAIGLVGYNALQPRSSTPGSQDRIYSLGQKITGVRWDYVVNGIQREPLAGTARPRGVYLAVRITLTSKGAEGAQASPSDFGLVDAAGTRYSAESLQSGVYSTPDNRSPFEWPTTYPPGRAVTTRVVFDVDVGLTGVQLVINELPGTKVKLE